MVGWLRQSIVVPSVTAVVVMLASLHAVAGQWPVLQAAGSVEERAELTPPTATAQIATTFPTLVATGALIENSQELAAVLHAMPLPPQAQARVRMKTRITEALVALEERAADRFAPTTTAKPAAPAHDVTTSLPGNGPVAVDVTAGPQPVPVASGPAVPSSLPTVRESAGTVPSSTTAATSRGTAASAPRDTAPFAGAPAPSDETTVASHTPTDRPVVMTPLFLPTPVARIEEPAAELPTDRQRTAREPTILARTPDAEDDDTDRRTSPDAPAATVPAARETSDTDTRTTDTRTTDTATRTSDESTRTSETQSTDTASRTTDGQASTSGTRSPDPATDTMDTRDTSTTATPTDETRTGETPPTDERVAESDTTDRPAEPTDTRDPADTSTETETRESARTSIVNTCTSRTLDCTQATSWALTERALGLAVAPRDSGGPIALVPIERDGAPLVIALDPRTQRTATCQLPKTGAPVEGNAEFQLSAGGAKQVAQWFATASRAMTEPPAADTSIPPCVADLGNVVRPVAAPVNGSTEDAILYRYDSTKTDSFAIDRDGTLLRVEEGKKQTSTVATLGTLGVTPRYVVERTIITGDTTPIVSGRAASTSSPNTGEMQLVVGSDRTLVTLDPSTWAVVPEEAVTFRQPDDAGTLILTGLSATTDGVLTVHQSSGTAVVSWIPVTTTR